MVAALLTAASRGAEPQPNPDRHVRLALTFQGAINEYDRPFIRFLSFWDVPEKDLWDYRRFAAFWVNQMSFERALRVPQEVPGSDGRLVWFDLRWWGWNSRAWRAVAERDPFTREPWVFHTAAEGLRLGAGYTGVKPVKGDDGLETTPVLAMVNGGWFLRETLETDRSPSYYDLLFARFRFPSEERVIKEKVKEEYEESETYYWPGGMDREGRFYHAGNYQRRVKKTRLVDKERKVGSNDFVDFPKDIGDWEKAFGIDKLKAFARDTTIDLDYGAVVAGGRDDPDHGSIVALNNRLLVIYDGPLGRHMRTYDVFKTHGDRDYSEKLIFKNGKFRKGGGADAVFDAGEILSGLPNGGQAGFLIDGKGNRAEIAATKAAQDTADKRINPGVRNYGSCLTCHAGGGGFVLPRDQEKEDQKLGIKRKIRDKEQATAYESFFQEWEEDAAAATTKYQRMVARTTLHPERIPLVGGEKAAPWNGSKIAEMTGRLRDEYDAMVTPERAALVLGVPADMLGYLASRGGTSEDGKLRNHRLQQLLHGKAVPSAVFEVDTFRQLGFLLDANRGDPEFKRLYGK